MTRMPRLYSAAKFENLPRARGNRQKNFIKNGCFRSFALVMFTTQKTLIMTIGLQQLIQMKEVLQFNQGAKTIKKFMNGFCL